jgi:hypothetical protein
MSTCHPSAHGGLLAQCGPDFQGQKPDVSNFEASHSTSTSSAIYNMQTSSRGAGGRSLSF